MRTILNATGLAFVVAALGGCGVSDDSYRAAYRSRAISACANGARASPNAAAAESAGINFQRVCECAVDRHLANTTTQALRGEGKGKGAPPGAEAAMMQCVSEALQGAQTKTGG